VEKGWRAHEYDEKPCGERTRTEAKRRSTIQKTLLGRPAKKPRPF
jgi:ribosomal protein S21